MSGKSETLNEKKELVITRVFNAPRELVFKACTEATHLANWWGPAGLKLSVIKLEVRPGGTFLYGMHAENGSEMYGKFVYHAIQAPEKLVFVNSFSDKEGNIIRAPFSNVWPLEIMNTWTFTEEGQGKTKITLRGMPYHATEEEHKAFEEMFPSMQQGFGATFDQLDTYLTTL